MIAYLLIGPDPKIICDSLRTNVFQLVSELITVLARQLLTLWLFASISHASSPAILSPSEFH